MSAQGDSTSSRLRRLWPVLAVVLLLLLVGGATIGSSTSARTSLTGPPKLGHSSSCSGAACGGTKFRTTKVDSHPWMALPFYGTVALLIGVLVALLLVLLVAILWSTYQGARGVPGLRRRSSSIEHSVEEDATGVDAHADARLARAVDAGLAGLSGTADARAAVIACWVGLERAAAGAGVPRRPAETSAELAQRLLTDRSVEPRVLTELGELYRSARFARRPVEDAERRRAIDLLEQVRQRLGAPAVGADG